jgi:hypothetical protein
MTKDEITDRKMLELAAKAAGYATYQFSDYLGFQILDAGDSRWWNPLTNDGDAFRLAVKLGVDLELHGCNSMCPYVGAYDCERNIAEEDQPGNGDPYTATRRVIVRAAAEIERNKNG